MHLKDTDFASYADDNTPYTELDSIDQVVSRLKEIAESLFKWCSHNQTKANNLTFASHVETSFKNASRKMHVN